MGRGEQLDRHGLGALAAERAVEKPEGAEGDGDANAQVAQVYRFLGGRFVASATDPLVVSTTPPPASDDPVALWQWFSQEARVGRKRADALWEQLFPRTEA